MTGVLGLLLFPTPPPFWFPLLSVVAPRPPLWRGELGGDLSCPPQLCSGFLGALWCLRFNVSEVGCVLPPVAPGEVHRPKRKSGSWAGGAGPYQPPGALLFSARGSQSWGDRSLPPPPAGVRKATSSADTAPSLCFPSGSFSLGNTDKDGTTSHGEGQRAFFCKRPDSKHFQLYRDYLMLPLERERMAGTM